MTRHNADPACTLSTSTPCLTQSKGVVEISDLKNDSVLFLVISRAVHLKDVFSSIDSMRITRDFNIYEFPFSNKRSLINAITTNVSSLEDNCGLGCEMNKECLQRNLASFVLAVDAVLGNGDCCFSSIVKQLHKVLSSKEDEENSEFLRHLRRLGFQTATVEDTKLLRSLFCKEIKKILKTIRTGWISI